jgi:hypothetical protein
MLVAIRTARMVAETTMMGIVVATTTTMMMVTMTGAVAAAMTMKKTTLTATAKRTENYHIKVVTAIEMAMATETAKVTMITMVVT